MERKALERRYRYLWSGESASIVLFSVLFFTFAIPSGEWSNWILRGYSLLIVIMILTQGVVWWRWKLRILRAGRRTLPAGLLTWFHRFRTFNWVLIALFPLVAWFKSRLTGSFQWGMDEWVGLLILIGAILEQINYYYYQLMYDNRYDWDHLKKHRRLRRGTVAKVLDADRT